MPKIGPFQEADGAVSMRRILAFFFAIGTVAVLAVGAFKASMPAVWGGLVLAVAVLVLLFFTTWQEVTALISAWKAKE